MSVLAHRRKAFQGGGGGGFVPTDIAGLLIWVDADADVQKSGGSPAGNGDTVTAWLDQSGNSANPTTLTSLVYNTSPSRVTFSTSSRLSWSTNPASAATAATIFAVLDIPSAETLGILFSNNSSFGYLPYFSSGSSNPGWAGAIGTPGIRVDGAALSSPTRGSIYTAACISTPIILTMTGCDFTAAGAWSNIGINNYAGVHFDFTASEILIYNATPSGGDIGSIESYLAAKWGVTL